MAKFEIKMPKMAESITEGTIIKWWVKVGDKIEEDDVLFEVETAKVSAEIPSPVAGTVLDILFKAGDIVAVGTVVAVVETEGEVSVDSSEVSVAEEPIAETPIIPTEKSSSDDTVKKPKSDTDQWFSPVVLQLAQEAGIPSEELKTIPGTGYLGRLSKKDIKNYISHKGSHSGPTAPSSPASLPTTKINVEVPEVERTPKSSDNSTIVEMDNIRRITAERMVFSKHTSAHVTTVVEADVTKLVQWRNKHKNAFASREGISLTFMPAIVQATTKALIEFPQINASVDGTRIILKKQINIGIAVALDGWNLIVPVVHNADRLSISGLAQAIDSLATKARNNKLKMDDIQGGTFTITNFGSFKNIFGTPIINQPEVAILGVGYIEKKPAVIETPDGDVIAVRHKMYLSLSYDHRIIDGALGGAFLRRLADMLENIEGLELT